ncbi:MAG: glutathione S-transferase [Hyphomicrobiales bacterium]|nr:glutathione S-transferase [Hyphomicrobiales bacterium]
MNTSSEAAGLVLYHADTAVCAAKVRMALAEKGLSFEGRMVNLHKGEQFDPDYMKLNPNAVVPTLLHDGAVITESTVINEYLDDAFPSRPLRPADALGRARVHLWTKKEDTIHDTINTMTASIVFRHDLMQKTPEERVKRYAGIPDPAKREKWRRMLEEGLESAIVTDALYKLAKHFSDMEKALGKSAWLAGDAFTLADVGLVSFFYRLEMLACEGLWRERFPAVTDWYARAKARPSFKAAILDYIPQAALDNYERISRPLWPRVAQANAKATA